jgi:hypothetical protein
MLNTNHFWKSVIVGVLITAILVTNISVFSRVKAESGEGKDVFKVIVTLFGITNSTKDVLTLVSVKDQTKIKLFNAEDPQNQGQDKVSYTMTFPGINVDEGEPYTVCTMSTENFKLKCDEGNNSPLNRPEFMDIDVGKETTSSKDNSKEKKG